MKKIIKCEDCKEEFKHEGRGRTPTRCPDCKKKHDKQVQRERDQKRRKERIKNSGDPPCCIDAQLAGVEWEEKGLKRKGTDTTPPQTKGRIRQKAVRRCAAHKEFDKYLKSTGRAAAKYRSSTRTHKSSENNDTISQISSQHDKSAQYIADFAEQGNADWESKPKGFDEPNQSNQDAISGKEMKEAKKSDKSQSRDAVRGYSVMSTDDPDSWKGWERGKSKLDRKADKLLKEPKTTKVDPFEEEKESWKAAGFMTPEYLLATLMLVRENWK